MAGNTKPNIPRDEAPRSVGAPSINLLDLVQDVSAAPAVDLVKLTADETALVLFTPETTEVHVHYCHDTEIRGYARCAGSDCLLCRVGRRRDRRLLLPVYLPAEATVGALPLSPSLRPHALLPQLINVLKSGSQMVVFVRREESFRYIVSTTALTPNTDSGEIAIRCFLAEFESGEFDLASLYPLYENEQLAMIPEIDRMMKLKGYTIDASDTR